MVLSLADAGNKKLKVIKINGGCNVKNKLYHLGIYEGVEVEKKISYKKGPVIVKVLNSEVAIGRGMAEKIVVEEVV